MALAVVVTPDVKVLGASEMLAKLVTGDTFSVNPVDVPSLTAMASGLGVDMAVAQAPFGDQKVGESCDRYPCRLGRRSSRLASW